MFVSIYYKPCLFNAHTMILIVHIFMNVNKLCLNQSFSLKPVAVVNIWSKFERFVLLLILLFSIFIYFY